MAGMVPMDNIPKDAGRKQYQRNQEASARNRYERQKTFSLSTSREIRRSSMNI